MIVLLLCIVLILLVGVFVAFVGASKNVRSSNDTDDFPSLSFDSQAYYRPIRTLVRSIRQVCETSSDPAVKAMAGSVDGEIRQTHDRVVQALQTRDQLRKAIDGHANARSEVERLTQLHDGAESPQEKLSYAKALEAKSGELAEYEKAKLIIKKIEDEIETTKASLSELKAKLAVTDATSNASERAEDLRSSLGSLETIQTSVSEAQEVLRT